MRFATPLIPATLVRRYKRFLADAVLDDGTEVTAHCPNPGAMTGQAAPGARIWLEPNDDPKRKLKYGWRLTDLPGGHRVVVDTGLPNRVLAEALRARAVPGLDGYDTVRAEVGYGAKSRVDFLLTGRGQDIYVEVKAVTLRRTGDLAEFPDCVTLRGARHMGELAEMVASDIDPGYGRAFDAARVAGVEVIALDSRITVGGVWAKGALPFTGTVTGG